MNPFVSAEHQRDIVLASRSPRRADILRGLGFSFTIDPPDTDVEQGIKDEDPFALPELLACRKHDAVAGQHPGALVLAADTVVIIDGDILNKPADDAQARDFLRRLSGSLHTVVTGVAMSRNDRRVSGSARTRVRFRDLGADQIAAYVATGEGRDKAGSYAAQGLGSGLIASIDGCFYNVVGLPVALLFDLLDKLRKNGG